MTLADWALNLLKHKNKPLIIMKIIYFLIVFNNMASPGYLRVPISWRLRSDITTIFVLLCIDSIISYLNQVDKIIYMGQLSRQDEN